MVKAYVSVFMSLYVNAIHMEHCFPQKPFLQLTAGLLLSVEILQSCGVTMGLISLEPTEN